MALTEQDLTFGCVLHSKAHDPDREIIDFSFVANNWPDTLENSEPDKCKELKFVSLNNLPDNIVPHVVHGINCVVNNIP